MVNQRQHIETPHQLHEQLDDKQLWENVLVDIELNVSKANFNTWFKDTHVIKQQDGIVHLGVPNQFVKDWLTRKYHTFILKALRGFAENTRGIEYVISRERSARGGEERVTRERTPMMQGDNELPLENYYINKNDNLNPRYMFDTFVVGPFNELAYAAAQAIVKKPGIIYNPLFVYGGTGHGKTHLIQSIGNYVKKVSPDRKIYYATSERFAVDYLNAIQTNKVSAFKEKYRQYDIFIMDDIQFLSKKEKTQEELFHLFNTLYDNNKQIVFSSDQHPSYLPEMEDRLKSRFSAGMIVDISAPDHESRIAILKTKAQSSGISVPNEILEYLASVIQGNIRELEGALNSVMCQAQLLDRPLSVAEVEQLVKESAKPKKNASIAEVVERVAEYYGIDEASIYEKTRRKEVVKPRQLIMYILREDHKISYPTIGSKLGGRDHTTVIHSCEKVRNDLKSDPALAQELNQIRILLK